MLVQAQTGLLLFYSSIKGQHLKTVVRKSTLNTENVSGHLLGREGSDIRAVVNDLFLFKDLLKVGSTLKILLNVL